MQMLQITSDFTELEVSLHQFLSSHMERQKDASKLQG